MLGNQIMPKSDFVMLGNFFVEECLLSCYQCSGNREDEVAALLCLPGYGTSFWNLCLAQGVASFFVF